MNCRPKFCIMLIGHFKIRIFGKNIDILELDNLFSYLFAKINLSFSNIKNETYHLTISQFSLKDFKVSNNIPIHHCILYVIKQTIFQKYFFFEENPALYEFTSKLQQI